MTPTPCCFVTQKRTFGRGVYLHLLSWSHRSACTHRIDGSQDLGWFKKNPLTSVHHGVWKGFTEKISPSDKAWSSHDGRRLFHLCVLASKKTRKKEKEADFRFFFWWQREKTKGKVNKNAAYQAKKSWYTRRSTSHSIEQDVSYRLVLLMGIPRTFFRPTYDVFLRHPNKREKSEKALKYDVPGLFQFFFWF